VLGSYEGKSDNAPTNELVISQVEDWSTGRFTTSQLADSEFVNITFGAIIYFKFYIKPFWRVN